MSDSGIWTPGGQLPPDVRQAQNAIENYDSRLELGFDQRNNQWVVLWKDAVDGAPYPVLGLGYDLPGYDEIMRLLWKGDTVRRGGDIIKDVNRRNAARKAETDAEAHDRAGEVAEHLEHTFRRMGKTSYNRIFVP